MMMTRGAWAWVFDNHNRPIGVIEQIADGRWRAMPMHGDQIGVACSREAAISLIRDRKQMEAAAR
jgi:hypothetical protein